MQLEEVGNVKINNLKVKSSKVLVEYEIDNNINKIKLPIEIYSKYKLLNNTLIPLNKWNEILKESKKIEIKETLMKIYSSKTRSIYNTRNKALKYYYDDEDLLEECINELKLEKLLDDSKFIKEYYEYLEDSLYGKYYILNFFRNNEIDKELLKDLDFNESKEKEKAIKYLGNLLDTDKYNFMKVKVKIYNSLLSRGFDQGLTYDIINSLNIDRNKELELLNKEFNKLKDKELRKNKEIDYQVIIKKLISKGYRISDIKEVINLYKGENND